MLDLSNIELARATTNKDGHASLAFQLSDPQFLYLESGGEYYECYLSPGDDLKTSLTTTLDSTAQHYSGKGGDVNNYLFDFQVVKENFFNSGKGDFLEYNIEDFSARLDSMIQLFSSYHNLLSMRHKLGNEEMQILQRRYELNILLVKQTYYDYLKIKGVSDKNIPSSLVNSAAETPFDAKLLSVGMVEYARVLLMYMNLNVYNPIIENNKNKGAEILTKQYPVYAQEYIKSQHFSEEITDLLLAYNLHHWLNIQGITSQVDSLYQDVVKRDLNGQLLRVTRESYGKWINISNGKIAPDFSGKTPDGNQVSLYDYRGKVVYIDVWATWCGPCIAEFDKMKALHNRYDSHDDIAFFFVSIDRNVAAWKKYVSEHRDLTGIHMNQKEIDINLPRIQDSYLINAIPRYILIDKDGKIVEYNAPRPSSESLTSRLKDLLMN